MADMEIMREFEEELGTGIYLGMPCGMVLKKEKVKQWLKPAVKREIVRVLQKVHDNIFCLDCHDALHKIREEYRPKPQYCEGMQEALKDGRAVDIGGGIRLNLAYNCGKVGAMRISVCPFCKEGKNCIGDK